jgi:hypothetical protein
MAKNESNTEVEILLQEYEVISEMHRHYDNINMSLMAFLVAVVFAVWGIVFQNSQTVRPVMTFIIAWSALVVLSLWLQHMAVHRTIIQMKLRRARKIEQILGMYQNRIFSGFPKRAS